MPEFSPFDTRPAGPHSWPRRPSLAAIVIAALVLATAVANLPEIPTRLHEAVDLRRAERWSHGDRAEQAAFVLTMLHRAHPDSSRITLALALAQRRAGDEDAVQRTLEQSRNDTPRDATWIDSKLKAVKSEVLALPSGERVRK